MLAKLPQVHLGNQYPLESLQHLMSVFRHGVEISEVGARYAHTLLARSFHSRRNRSVGAAPPEHQKLAACVTGHLERGDGFGNARDLLRPRGDHVFMIIGFVADLTADVPFLQATDTVFEPGSAG